MDKLLLFLQKDYIKKWDCKVRHLLNDHSIDNVAATFISWLDNENVDFFDATTLARDFYIGSDLTNDEKKTYYSALVYQGFFKKLNTFLYSNKFGVCSWTIYTMGKFSHENNAYLLETAYEKYYRDNNPFLSYRCLGELEWLNKTKCEPYLLELENSPNLTNHLILLYYSMPRSYDNRFKELIKNETLRATILGNPDQKNAESKIEEILWDFENYFAAQCYPNDTIKIDRGDFEKMARSYFDNYENKKNG